MNCPIVKTDVITRVVLEITLRCNRVCANCNRMIGIYEPPDSDMTHEQIDLFIVDCEIADMVLKQEGCIVFDDCGWIEGVNKAIAVFKEKYKHRIKSVEGLSSPRNLHDDVLLFRMV